MNLKFQYSTDSFVSFLYLLMFERSFMVCLSFFECVFTMNILSWQFFLSDFIVTIYRMFSRKQFPFKGQVFLLMQLHFRVFWFTGLCNTSFLLVLIFDLILGIHEWLILIVFLLNIFLYLCVGVSKKKVSDISFH